MMKIFFFLFFFAVGKSVLFDPVKHENWNLLPHKTCGQASSGRIIGGEEAPMNGYPWLARIGYSSLRGALYFLCDGTVVTTNVILTAGHCVVDYEHDMKLFLIRLGEHDTSTDPDCIGSYCADPVKDFKVSEVVIRPDFNKPPYQNDIGLIRLKTNIQFSDYIKPICFPSGTLFNSKFVGEFAEVAGWGLTDIDRSEVAEILQMVRLPIVKNQECSKVLPTSAEIRSTQLCVGGIKGQDSCGGDSGGPLMKLSDANGEPRYYILGIVSFGAKRCGKTRAPGIYTKLSSFMEWVLDNLVHNSQTSVVIHPQFNGRSSGVL